MPFRVPLNQSMQNRKPHQIHPQPLDAGYESLDLRLMVPSICAEAVTLFFVGLLMDVIG